MGQLISDSSTTLPSICPCAVRKRIADGVIAYSLSVITRQQIAPVGIAIGIGGPYPEWHPASGGVGVLLAGKDISGVYAFSALGSIGGTFSEQ